jgi:hypothetical protein
VYLPENPIQDVVLMDLVKPGEREIRVEYMPMSFTETKSSNYAAIMPMGRSEPILGYSGGGPRVFNFLLTFATTGLDPFNDVIAPLWLVRSWLYPDYSEMLANVPPRVLFIVGSWMRSRCVATRADITYHGPWCRDTSGPPGLVPGELGAAVDSMLPFYAEVNLVLQEVSENSGTSPFDHYDVDQGKDRVGAF